MESVPAAPDGRREPIVLKNDIAVLDPEPIAKGAFGQIYLGRIRNPVGLLAERVVRGEEDPRWLGLDSLPFEEPSDVEARRPCAITDPAVQARVYEAARRLWNEYLDRHRREGPKAREEYRTVLNLIDPLLVDGHPIVVKVLRPAPFRAGGDETLTRDLVRRFLKENDILRQLRHPNIVRRFGLVHDPRLGWCMLLEYVQGETLDEYMKKCPDRRIPLPVAARMARELVSALEYTQERGIIHRDLKPRNIMVRAGDGRITLMDFGIGKWIDESETQPLTLPGDRVGTPPYMAPEQVVEGAGVTWATDVYQLSTVLFEMVTGHAAYENLQMVEIFAALHDANAPHPALVRDHLAGVPRDFECLIEVGRAKNPDRRWTLREFRERIDRIIAKAAWGPEPIGASITADLEDALLAARIRTKEDRWEEEVLEGRLHRSRMMDRIGAVKEALAQRRIGEAREQQQALRAELGPLPRRYDPLRDEVETLGALIERQMARQRISGLLDAAERDFAAQQYVEAAAALDLLKERLKELPPDGMADFWERYRSLSGLFDDRHRSFVDLFLALRNSLIAKIEGRCREFFGPDVDPASLPADSLRELLDQVAMAENNLATLDREKIGPRAHDEAARLLRTRRAQLEAVLQAHVS